MICGKELKTALRIKNLRMERFRPFGAKTLGLLIEVSIDDFWTDESSNYQDQLSTWNDGFTVYRNYFENYVSGGTYTYTVSNGDIVKHTNINVNRPSCFVVVHLFFFELKVNSNLLRLDDFNCNLLMEGRICCLFMLLPPDRIIPRSGPLSVGYTYSASTSDRYQPTFSIT